MIWKDKKKQRGYLLQEFQGFWKELPPFWPWTFKTSIPDKTESEKEIFKLGNCALTSTNFLKTQEEKSSCVDFKTFAKLEELRGCSLWTEFSE